MNVTLYTTHCPRCTVLEKKLKEKNIEYDIVEDEETIIQKGFMTVPILEVDCEVMNFSESVKWVNNKE